MLPYIVEPAEFAKWTRTTNRCAFVFLIAPSKLNRAGKSAPIITKLGILIVRSTNIVVGAMLVMRDVKETSLNMSTSSIMVNVETCR